MDQQATYSPVFSSMQPWKQIIVGFVYWLFLKNTFPLTVIYRNTEFEIDVQQGQITVEKAGQYHSFTSDLFLPAENNQLEITK